MANILGGYYYGYDYSLRTLATVFSVISILTAVAAAVVAFIFLMSEEKRAKLSGFMGTLADFVNFKTLFIEKILKCFYVAITVYCVVDGFFTLFFSFGTGIVLMLLGPIIVRLVFEAAMLFILLVQNVIEINKKLRTTVRKAPEAVAEEVVEAPVVEAAITVCPTCGTARNGEDPFCANCGYKF